MVKQFVFFIAILLLPVFGFSQDLDCRFEKLFLDGDMAKWEQLVDSLQKVKLDKADDETLIYAEYGLIGYLLAMQKKSKAEIEVEQFDQHIQRLLLREPTNANYLALDAALVGFKVGLSPWKAPFIGSDSNAKIEKALKYRKNEIMPITEQANAYYFRPAFAGGDKHKAMLLYEKAFKLQSENTNCNWRYYSNGSWLGQVYSSLGETQKARDIYLMLLTKAPNFQFVKNELLPQLEQGKFNDVGGSFQKMLQ